VMVGLVKASGRPVEHNLRAMVDAVFYVVRNGVKWRASTTNTNQADPVT
jgi:transposase